MEIATLNLPLPSRESVPADERQAILRAGDRFFAQVLEVQNGRDALIAFGRFSAYARLPLPVSVGQEIQVGVESAGQGLRLFMMPIDGQAQNNPSMGPLVIDPFEMVSAKAAASLSISALSSGTALQARVTGFEKDGQMLLDFGGFKAFAKVDIPVHQGQTLMLNVVQNDQGLFLSVNTSQTPAIPSMSAGASASAGRVALPTEKEMDGFRQAIESLDKSIRQIPQPLSSEGARASESVQTTPVQSALANLQQILSPVSPGDNLENLMPTIRRFVEDSGVYFEKKLESIVRSLQPGPPDGAPATMASQLAGHPAVRALMDTDLKPNLLVLKQFLEVQTEKNQNADRATLETLRRVVDQTLANIEQQQQAATEKPASADVFQAFSHLLHLADPKQNARLKVYYAKKSKNEEAKPPRVSLLLEMDRLGTLRSDLWMVGKDLNITFFVKDADVKSTIEAAHHQIKTMLHDTFNTVAVSVVVSEKKIDAFDGEDLLPTVHRQLDVNA